MKVFIVLQETNRNDIIQHVIIKGVYDTYFNALQKVDELYQLHWQNQVDDISVCVTIEEKEVEHEAK